jgi:hypothetical protein
MTDDMQSTATFTPNGAQPTMTATLKAIAEDAVALVKQQLAMFKAELRADVRNVLTGVIPMVCGIAPLLLGGLMSCFALVHLLHWLTTPAGQSLDAATLPLWACYAIVSGTFLAVGGTLLGIGIYRLKTLRPLAAESTKSLEENIQWLMNGNPK